MQSKHCTVNGLIRSAEAQGDIYLDAEALHELDSHGNVWLGN